MPVKTNLKAWKPKQKKWMANRQQEWERVQQRLPGFPGIKRGDWWEIEEYFFTGRPLPPSTRSFQWADRLILKWWLHPEGVNSEGIASIHVAGMRITFQHICADINEVVRRLGGDSEYGLMGGKEQEIILFLNRGWDPRVLVDYGDGTQVGCCSFPTQIFTHWLSAMDREIEAENHIAHGFGLVYFDYVLEMMEQVPNAAFELDINRAILLKGKLNPRRHIASQLKNTVPKLLRFFDRNLEDPALQRQDTVAYVRRFVDGYQNKTFPKALVDLIDLTLASIKAEEKKHLEKNAKRRELRAKAKSGNDRVKKKMAKVSKKGRSTKKKIIKATPNSSKKNVKKSNKKKSSKDAL